MNPIDTLRLINDHQAAMRNEVRLNALTRRSRTRRRTPAFDAGDAATHAHNRREAVADPRSTS